MCVDCVIASPSITQVDPGRRTPSLRWFCHIYVNIYEQVLRQSMLPQASMARGYILGMCHQPF
jgi:hypothetical protein